MFPFRRSSILFRGVNSTRDARRARDTWNARVKKPRTKREVPTPKRDIATDGDRESPKSIDASRRSSATGLGTPGTHSCAKFNAERSERRENAERSRRPVQRDATTCDVKWSASGQARVTWRVCSRGKFLSGGIFGIVMRTCPNER